MASYKEQIESSGLSGGNAAYIEELYEDFLADPDSVGENWQQYFKEIKANSEAEVSRLDVQAKFEALAKLPAMASGNAEISNKQLGVLNLIKAYRLRGHWHADLDPAKIRERHEVPAITLAYHGLSEADLDTVFSVNGAFGQSEMKLRDLVEKLSRTYSSHLGLEYAHVWEKAETVWLTETIEKSAGEYPHSADDKKHLLRQLVAADGMEKYLHKRYVGQKRFSLEGGDALIPLTNTLICELAHIGTEEICIGMAHRGRLNMLINILGKKPQVLFDEFDGKFVPAANRSGDVKYHMGFSSYIEVDGQKVDLSLAYNPSHLEFVNAVTLGSTRARLERRRMEVGQNAEMLDVANKAVPIVIHGDAALAGQGINQEVLQLSQLRGYQVGGSIHIAVNNQIGFTTSNLQDARSSMYCTDIAKSIQAPIIHVNGDDPEAVAFAGKMAVGYLKRFQKDIFIDLVCYRRLGHNEADEPSATQPKMYEKIRNHPVPAKVYADKLVKEGVIDKDTYQAYQEDYRVRLESGERVAEAKQIDGNGDFLAEEWKALANQDWDATVDTTFPIDRLKVLGERTFSVPEDFTPHALVKRILANRREMAAGEQSLDWGAAENLAYATLLDQGYQIRVSGEDCGRGTFSHRHAVLHDQKTGESYLPLQHLKDNQPSVRVIDSLLSETGVLGFEYGYSIAEPKGLTIWEAQFGDFANVAQVIIDQFIASGETKWGRYSGLVMLLPHGYEGQGPEHSSARLERYLQLCADDNMQVCVPTTPAQVYHMLRRQVLRDFRKPLIVMSPKSLLRHKLAVSELSELAEGHFQEVIGEIDAIEPKEVKRIVFCSGKVYYDLLQKRRDDKITDIAIIRLEQIYPFPKKAIKEILAKYPEQAELIWCQEEPRNQGAWHHLIEPFMNILDGRSIRYAGRPESASTAAGYAKVHAKEQSELVDKALDL
ncbi:2-oxoglutarate dehydrogenase E1 component [Suttonella ornithocola]|uniref:2-oxoglutarate dehydrogenase E1 component n=1 Tax=Suttonella ornithocola TaxID=279832 RepID=A0A380MUZ1_9GAMM|nr:2-oxoglutarate dehydrogenase E1 component [Suttonella ornithocola]SUO95531.1 2-oxoglutarate dehydrogenase E1 component [Suttonella ornithocola]